MREIAVTIHLGTAPASPEVRPGARIEVDWPNPADPTVIQVEREGDDWIARDEAEDGDRLLGRRASFAEALDDALGWLASEVGQWR